MKSLYLKFEDKEFKKLKSAKDRVNKRRKDDGVRALSWEKFVLLVSEAVL